MFKSLVCNREQKEEYIDCYTVDEVTDDFYTYNELVIKRNYKEKTNDFYYYMPAFFDIETSHNHKVDNLKGWLYQWAYYFQDKIVCGRTPDEFIEFIKKISYREYDAKLTIYVHNLSYEFQYLKDYLYKLDNSIRMLAIRSHQILSIELPKFGITFKCSYRLSNMSLAGWCDKYKTYHVKAVDAIDYDVIRYQDSELKANDWYYMVSDVVCMKDCYIFESEGYNIATIPLTSTGFVRNDMRNEFKVDRNERNKFKNTALSPSDYLLCKRAFAGGLTHGNRFLSGQLIKGDIGHFDFRSFYPSVIACRDFPMSKFGLLYELGHGSDDITITDVLNMARDYCMLIEIEFDGVVLNKSCTLPILQISKIEEYNRYYDYKIKFRDNGRALVIEGVFSFLFTELDLETFSKQYTTKRYRILRVLGAKKDKLPEWFRKMNDKYFYNKYHLKHSDPVLYAKSKAKLNAQYGMSATDPVKNETIIDWLTGEWSENNKHKVGIIEDELAKYYKRRSSFMRYQWGVWVTSYCRNQLVKMVELVGYENFLYCDTDSIFFIKTPENIAALNKWNEQNYKDRVARGEYIKDENGDPYVYLAFEDEEDHISAYKFLHAKCYGMETDKGLKLTIAGVPASATYDGKKITREEELKTLDNLRDGFVFSKCGGKRIAYMEKQPTIENINGHMISYASSGIILPKEYEVGRVDELGFVGLVDGVIV